MTDHLNAPPQERRMGVDRRAPVPKSKAPAYAVGGALLALCIWNATQQVQIAHMSNTEQADRQELAVKGVNDHMALLADELATVSEKQKDVMLRADFAMAQQALTKQLEALKAQLDGTTQDGSSSVEILAIKAQIESVQAAVDSLDKRVIALAQRPASIAPPRTVKAISRSTPKPAQTVVKLSPPFQVIGLEVRGGERFLSIAPNGSTRLEQISLIRPGDTRYDWQLRTLGSNTAEFQVNGTTQVLTLQ